MATLLNSQPTPTQPDAAGASCGFVAADAEQLPGTQTAFSNSFEHIHLPLLLLLSGWGGRCKRNVGALCTECKHRACCQRCCHMGPAAAFLQVGRLLPWRIAGAAPARKLRGRRLQPVDPSRRRRRLGRLCCRPPPSPCCRMWASRAGEPTVDPASSSGTAVGQLRVRPHAGHVRPRAACGEMMMMMMYAALVRLNAAQPRVHS